MKINQIINILIIGFSCIQGYSQCNGSNSLCDKKYNEVAYLTTHNSFSSTADNYSYPNQNYNITSQLNEGVRALMIDVYDVNGIPTCYHGFESLGSTPLISVLNEIESFLNNNPNEIVTIIFECYITANAIETVFSQTNLLNLAYSHTLGMPWPTLQEMITNNERLVVFSDVDDANANQDWYHYVWENAVETHFSVSAIANFSCDYNRGDAANDLFILNHFITNGIGIADEGQATLANSMPFFKNRVIECQQFHNKFPNFLTVDFYELGDALQVVNECNGIFASTEEIHESTIKLYPNPSTNAIILEKNNIDINMLQITDFLGNDLTNAVIGVELGNNKIRLDISNLSAGVYILILGDDVLSFAKN